MLSINDFSLIMLANMGIFFFFVTLLTRSVNIEALLNPNLKTKLIYTFFCLILAFVIMQFPFTTEAGNRIDLRAVAIYTAGIFGGPLPGILVGASVGLYRFFLSGAGAEIGLISSLIQGVAAGLYSRHYLKDRLLNFNPFLSWIPVTVSVFFHIIVILSFPPVDTLLWPFRITGYVFQFVGTVILVAIIQDALKISLRTSSLKRDVITDKVTNIYNIKYLDPCLNDNLALAKQNRTKLSIIFLDIDYFKTINDTYGHQKGDKILFKVAQSIKNSLRPYDTVGRYGGDEFLVILPGCDTAEANTIGERIMANIARLNEIENLECDLSASLGIATYPTHGTTSEILIKKADNALYQAKNSGRKNLITAS